jgi:hypothetical protein
VRNDVDVGDNVSEPDVGMTRVVSMPAVVVLPAPLGPSSPKISPVHRQVQFIDGAKITARRTPW